MSKISNIITNSSSIKKSIEHSKCMINQEIEQPTHYTSKSGKDVIDWCEDFGIMSNAYVFNIFKYLCRAGKKNNNSELQDALKAEVYLKRYIESLKNIQ